MLGPAPSLLQTVVDGGATVVTGGASQPVSTVTTVPVVTTPVMMDPPMMTTVLPVIFAVAVIKALILGRKIQYLHIYK